MIFPLIVSLIFAFLGNFAIYLLGRTWIDRKVREAIESLEEVEKKVTSVASERRRQRKARLVSKTTSKYRGILVKYNTIKSISLIGIYFILLVLISTYVTGSVILPFPLQFFGGNGLLTVQDGSSIIFLIAFLIFLPISARPVVQEE